MNPDLAMCYESLVKLEPEVCYPPLTLERNISGRDFDLDEFIGRMVEPELAEITLQDFANRTGLQCYEPQLRHDVSYFLNLSRPDLTADTVKVQQNYQTEVAIGNSYHHLKQLEDQEERSSTREVDDQQPEEKPIRTIRHRRTRCRSRPNRDLTTISKVIFTPFKKLLKAKECPVNLSPYFQVCEYSTNHRTLLDFELPFLFVELLDRRQHGVLQQFRGYLNRVRHEIIQTATLTYGSTNISRLETFKNYLNRIYDAYNSGQDCRGRMKILYNGISNPKITERLAKLQAKLSEKVDKLFH